MVELELVGNQWKHDGNLILRYWGLRSSSTTTDGPVAGHRALGDLMLELVPFDGGVLHEMAFEDGTVEIVADDVSHRRVQRSMGETVYVLTPAGGYYPAGIWSRASEAGMWIELHDAKGMLSKYELGASAYDAAVRSGVFKPTRPDQETNAFITKFTSAIDHWHHVEGTEA